MTRNPLATVLTHFAAFLLALASMCAKAESVHVRIVYVGDESRTAYIGAKQGLNEANHQGQFLGQSYSLELASLEALIPGNESNYSAVIAALDAEQLLALSAALPNTPIMNVTAEDDSLREGCTTNLFHVIPTRRMKADAVSQWQQKHPDADVTAQAWHPDFELYAGRELNNRFRKANGIAMDDNAWAGWAAVKMLSDTVAREGLTDPKQLRTYFSERLRFDGQKGLELSFRDTGQLRQPLLIVEDGKLLGEAPVRGVVDTTHLDSLGLVNCPK
ncbi:MAG: hypothetical protein L0Y67_05675 [Gammaproteobacteria bacterium]|nr:hypothetical protein [Gammaproteobacteria bacterium]MCI0591076.1 hypothetical protein [Gammaproteobacteria bacterium]